MRLDYRRAPEVAAICPDEEAFLHLVGIFARGENPFAADGAYTVRVAFARRGALYRATVSVIWPDGTEPAPPEEHVARECAHVALDAASTAYLVAAPIPQPPPVAPPAVATEPMELPSLPLVTPPPAPPAVPSANPSPPAPPAQSQREMDVTIGLSALVLMSAGLTGDVGPGFGIMADVRGEVFSLGLELRGMLPSRTYATEPIPGKVPTRTSTGFDASQWTALLVPCFRWKYLVGCGVAQGGLFFVQNSVQGAGFPNVAFGPRLGFEVPFAGRFAVFGMAEALFYVLGAQPGFAIGTAGTPPSNLQWSQSPVSGFFGAGLSVKFE